MDDAVFTGAFPAADSCFGQFAGSCGTLPLLVGVHPRPIALSSHTKAAWRTKRYKEVVVWNIFPYIGLRYYHH